VLKERATSTDDDFKQLQLLSVPLIKDAAFAKEKGIVSEIQDFPSRRMTESSSTWITNRLRWVTTGKSISLSQVGPKPQPIVVS
jgi:hypothetical protein